MTKLLHNTCNNFAIIAIIAIIIPKVIIIIFIAIIYCKEIFIAIIIAKEKEGAIVLQYYFESPCILVVSEHVPSSNRRRFNPELILQS